jgi:hypothetical protein
MASNDFNLNDTFELKSQVIAYNYDHNIKIYQDSVLYDGRCPQGFLCLWEGNAGVRYKFIYNHIAHNVILNTYYQFSTDTIIQGYKIKLVSLSPLPRSGVKTEQKDYKSVMVISR